MPPVNPRIPADEDKGTDWKSLALPRIYPNTADPRMPVIQPQADQFHTPDWGTTPPPPEVWAAAFNSQAPPATAPLWSWEALNAARQPVGNIDPRMVVPVPTDQGYIRPAQINPPPEVSLANAPQNPLLQQLIAHILRTGGRI